MLFENFTTTLHFFSQHFQRFSPAETFDIGTKSSMKAHATVLIIYDRISYHAKTYY